MTPDSPEQNNSNQNLSGNKENQPPVPSEKTIPESASATSSSYMVQVGAVSSEQKAKEWQQLLSQHFNVPGRVTQFGNVHRVQLGPFSSRQQAAQMQKKLTDQMHQSSFIVAP